VLIARTSFVLDLAFGGANQQEEVPACGATLAFKKLVEVRRDMLLLPLAGLQMWLWVEAMMSTWLMDLKKV
jgi:hypothetical protein